MSVELFNFGCRLALAEGEALRAAHADQHDLILVNSCAVTAEAERQARQAIRRAARRRPDARIVVTGCAAETSGARFAAMPEVAGLLRRADRPALAPAVSGAAHARAFVEVQNGCDHRCTFCIIPIGRGPSRSVPGEVVIDAIQQAVDRGQQEVVLTGVDLTSYAADGSDTPTLGALVDAILKRVPGLPRLRLSSLDSVEIDPLLEDLLGQEPRLMPHIHLSLQHGDDLILKRMKRRHARRDAVALCERLRRRRPEIAISADLIAGFPTESEAQFAASLSLFDACGLAFAHVFPYSPRPGTPAARMPQIDPATIRNRARRLRERSAACRRRWLAGHVGTIQSVLVELDGRTGHAPDFATVALTEALPPSNMRGQIVSCRILASDGATLSGIAA